MKLSLKNFRSYKDTTVEFGPGVNVIAGENDSGKTNLLRAINLVVSNRPTGDDYRSSWSGDTEILLGIDGKVVGRHRTNSENSYTLTHANGKRDEFKSFGTGVPDIIKRHLNISSVNIAFQLEGPFLLGQSAADVARHFNSVINLEVIDSAISNIASTLRKERATLKTEKEREEELTKKLEAYDWLGDAETKLAELERVQGVTAGLKTGWSTLYTLIKDFKKLQASSHLLSGITKSEEVADGLVQQCQVIKQLTDERSKLFDLTYTLRTLGATDKNLNTIAKYEASVRCLLLHAQDIRLLKSAITALSTNVRNLKTLSTEKSKYKEITRHENEADKLKALSENVVEKTKGYDALYDLLELHDKLSEQLANAEDKLTSLNFEFKELMPNVCPLCGQGIEPHD